VLFLAAILGIGLLLGWGFGGSLRDLALVRVRLWYAIPAALLLQAIPVRPGSGSVGSLLPVGVLLLSFAVLVAVVVANWRLRGFMLILLGLALNLAVIGVNQGMPVSAGAVARAGGADSVAEIPTERGGKHHLATEEDILVFLGDVIPIREPFGVVVSPGDVAMYVGASMFLGAAMLGRPVRSHRMPPEPQEVPGRQATQWGTPP
jgi:hypothetical protein